MKEQMNGLINMPHEQHQIHYRFFKIVLNFIEVSLICNIVLVSGVHQSDLALYIYIYIYIYMYVRMYVCIYIPF